MRNDEIAAISEAIKILTDDDALEVFKKAVPSASFVQSPPKHALDTWDFLQTSSTRKALARVHDNAPGDAVKHAGQAAKVVDFMIDNMVETLHEDDVNDEHKKDWCANETTVMHQLESDKKALTEELTKKLEQLDNELATLTEEIKTTTMEIEDLDADVFHATEQRKEEHKEFAAEFANADLAQSLVKKAAKRLEKFYSPNAASASLLSVRQRQPRAPVSAVVARLSKDVDFDSFIELSSKTKVHSADGTAVDPIVLPDTPQKYEKSESGGVMGLMNNMISDLESDMREGEVEEKHAAKDYVKLMKESTETRASLVKSLKEKKLVKADKEETRMQTNQRNDLTIEEVKHLQLYLAQLHTECDFLMRNFDNRHEARVGEEQGLESAESIVTHEEVQTHGEIEAEFKSEDSIKDVQEHYPDEPMPVF